MKPDFRTIADFRRVNRSAFKQVFREFVILCRQLDLFGRELLAMTMSAGREPNARAAATPLICAPYAHLAQGCCGPTSVGATMTSWLQVLFELQRDGTRKETYADARAIVEAHAGGYGIGLAYARDMIHP